MGDEENKTLVGTAEDMRHDILTMCYHCGRQNGHLGGCMSAVEVLAVLYTKKMNLIAANKGELPWDGRDRFIMSKGHAAIAMYAALKQAGILSQQIIDGAVRGENNIIYRHPKRNTEYAIETSVGSLGIGMGYAVGLCEAFRIKKASSKVYVMVGDGECNEGAIWESAAYAGAHKLDNLTVIVDKNGLQLDGYTNEILSMESLREKWRSFGFKTLEINGHDFVEIIDALNTEHEGKPLAIISHTIKGKGCSFAQDRVEWHDNWLSDELYVKAKKEIGNSDYRNKARKLAEERNSRRNPIFNTAVSCDAKSSLRYDEKNIEKWNSSDHKHILGDVFEEFAREDDRFLLLFADCAKRINIGRVIENYPERCLEMGISEQNMIAVASALANEGFHVFTVAYAPFITARVLDQVRANIAYMKAPVKLIGLSSGLASSDLGATHTAFEDMANMRSLPNIMVESPCDQLEIVKTLDMVRELESAAYIRITIPTIKGNIHNSDYLFEKGSIEKLREGADALVLVTGAIVLDASKAIDILKSKGCNAALYNVHTIKPLSEAIFELMKQYKYVVTIEEHNIVGGLGSAVAELIADGGLDIRLVRIGIPDCLYYADIPVHLKEKAGITAEKISDRILDVFKEK